MATESSETPPQDQPGAPARSEGIEIALVDDDRNILTTVSIALQAEGFVTRLYSDGETALKATAVQQFRLGRQFIRCVLLSDGSCGQSRVYRDHLSSASCSITCAREFFISLRQLWIGNERLRSSGRVR